jgi:hypothetical protein
LLVSFRDEHGYPLHQQDHLQPQSILLGKEAPSRRRDPRDAHAARDRCPLWIYPPKAALTFGITCSAISSIERLASRGSTQSWHG